MSYFYRGRHRAPTKTARAAAAVAATATVAAAGPVVAAPAALANTTAGFDADIIAECESGGKNIYNHLYESNPSYYSASGYFQITNSTWRANGGTEFAPTAIQATYEQQKTVAERIYVNAGYSYSDWSPSQSCWDGRIGSGSSVTIQKDDSSSSSGSVSSETPSSTTQSMKAQKRTEPVAEPTPKVVPQGEYSPDGDGEYVVQRGDTLSQIAVDNDTSVEALMDLNADVVEDRDWIYEGERLRLA